MRVGFVIALLGCAEPPVRTPVVEVDVPPLEHEPVDSGPQLEPQDTAELPAEAFACPFGSVALGLLGVVDGIEVDFTRNPGVGICLWPDSRRTTSTPQCPREAALNRAVFQRSAAELVGGGPEIQVCYRRVALCRDGLVDAPGMLAPFADCRGSWDEHVGVWLESSEPASLAPR